MLRHLCCEIQYCCTDIIIVTLLSVWNILYRLLFSAWVCAWVVVLEMLFHLKMHQGERLAQITPIQKVTTLSGICFKSSEFSCWDGLRIMHLFLCICVGQLLLLVFIWTGPENTQAIFCVFVLHLYCVYVCVWIQNTLNVMYDRDWKSTAGSTIVTEGFVLMCVFIFCVYTKHIRWIVCEGLEIHNW